MVGKRTESSGRPILDGDGAGRVVTIGVGRTVSIRGLIVRNGVVSGDGPAGSGGGIRNSGTLTLRDVVVRGDRSTNGGDISTAGTLVMNGASVVAFNHAAGQNGGGIDVDSTDSPASLVMNGQSAVRHKSTGDATGNGGGISIFHAKLTLNDRATVHHNSARN